MEFVFVIENEKGILKNKKGKEIQFDTEADALNYIDEHNVKNAVVRMDYAEDTEKEEDSGWNGYCPFCGSCNVDFVDEVNGEIKYICRCCDEDFLVNAETGKCTDRHRRPIRKEEDSMDYEFIFKDPITGAVITQKLSKMNKNYKSVRSAFYAFRRHTAKFMGVALKHITQFSEIKEGK